MKTTKEFCSEMVNSIIGTKENIFVGIIKSEAPYFSDILYRMNDYLKMSNKCIIEVSLYNKSDNKRSWEYIRLAVRNENNKIIKECDADRMSLKNRLKELFASIILNDLENVY